MPTFSETIKRATGCTDAEVWQIEDLMRSGIFHSTLDWQNREELEDAARLAFEVVRQGASSPRKLN
ncbi:MAG: hypothetical protein HZA89_07310 [Verrucomicrobia bacterium]|nr:hypothetical protein [Verrucomicrobiota bacterium]